MEPTSRASSPIEETPEVAFQSLRDAIEDAEDEGALRSLDGLPDAARWRDGRGLTLLHLAARNGRTAVVARLLDMGANPACRDLKRRTPLHDAVVDYERSLPSLHLLLAAGSPIDARNAFWDTPLMVACTYSNLYAVSALVAWGAKDRFRGRTGTSARDNVRATLDSARKNRRKYRRQIVECELILEIMDRLTD